MKSKNPPRTSSEFNGNAANENHLVIDMRVFMVAVFLGVVLMFFAGAGLGTGGSPLHSSWTEDVSRIKETSNDLKEDRINHMIPSIPSVNDRIPAGKHLLVDMRNVDGDFLSSEVRLIHAMEKVVDLAQKTLLTHACHKVDLAGIACAGVLFEGHISLHTWPDNGVILLDWFTATQKSLASIAKEIENIFGIPYVNKTGEAAEVDIRWYQDSRGVPSSTDMTARHRDGADTLDKMFFDQDRKSEVVSIQSEHQLIDVWDVSEESDTPSWSDVVKHNLQPGDPRLFTTELMTPDRGLFLDEVEMVYEQISLEYVEALVHPALFAHVDPRRIAIIDGGKSAVLREVLKHKTVEAVTMVEVDPAVVDIVREYLPSLSNCSDFRELSESCFDDERVIMVNTDGREWFASNFGDRALQETSKKEKFDVIIVDEQKNGFKSDVYTKHDYVTSMLDSLVEDGVIAMPLRQTPTINSPPPHMDLAGREVFLRMLEDHPRVEAMLVYEETRGMYDESSSFLIVCKSRICREQWYARSDVTDFKIYERILKTRSGMASLRHYDGATHHTYQFPSRSWETYYCRREPSPYECTYRGLDLTAKLRFLTDGDKESDFYIKITDDGTSALFASVPINKGDYIMPDELARSILVSTKSVEILEKTSQRTKAGLVAADFLSFIEKHGHKSVVNVEDVMVEVGATNLIRNAVSRETANVGRMMPKPEVLPTFSPVYERRRRSLDLFMVATKDIAVNEEILAYEGVWD